MNEAAQCGDVDRGIGTTSLFRAGTAEIVRTHTAERADEAAGPSSIDDEFPQWFGPATLWQDTIAQQAGRSSRLVPEVIRDAY